MKNPYTKEEFAKTYREIFYAHTKGKKNNNPEFVEHLKNLSADQIEFEQTSVIMVIGHTESNVTSVGETEYKTRTLNMDYISPSAIFVVAGDMALAKLAVAQLDTDEYDIDTTIYKLYDKYLESFTEKYSRIACKQKLEDLNFRQTAHRVNRFKFIPDTEEFNFPFIKVYAKIQNEGKEIKILIAQIYPNEFPADILDDYPLDKLIVRYNTIQIPANKKVKIKRAIIATSVVAAVVIAGVIVFTIVL